MKIAYRFIFGVLLSFAALHAHAAPYFASKDGSMIWDQATNLVWARCSLGQQWDGKTCAGDASKHDFNGAQAAAKKFNAAGGLGGFADWFVPTIRQLASLRACSSGFEDSSDLNDGEGAALKQCSVGYVNPTIDTNVFPSTPVEVFWSASPYSGDTNLAWSVFFYGGSLIKYYRNGSNNVRLARPNTLSSSDAALVFPNKYSSIQEEQEKQRKEAALKAEQERRAAEIKAEKERREAEIKAEKEHRAAELKADKERRAAEAARASSLKKLIGSGAKSMYLQAGKAQRSGGSISVNGISFSASELYELIIDKFPSSDYAVKATDQLSAMGRSERQTSSSNDTSGYPARSGQSVLICLKNGERCKAIMLNPGEDKSEVQYEELCTYALFTSASRGEKMWVPNSAISPKDGSRCH